MPCVVFISPGAEPAGWKAFQSIAKARGIVFASPRNAGNDCPPRRRVRIVLDVLDDLRRHHPIDPDRTYIGGFSGGGRIACAIAFALPELFGGVIPVCAGGNLREESWLRHRVIDRLSVALLTGETDFNRGEVERLRGPFLRGVGVRTRVWTQPRLGHGIPGEKTIAEAIQWLEEGLPARQKLAKVRPASRLATGDDTSREALARALHAEGIKRMQSPESLYHGLMQLAGVMRRWPDLEVGKQATKVLEDHDAKKEKPWEKDDVTEQRRFLLAQARAIDGYGSGALDKRYAGMRKDMLKEAVRLWQQILDDSPDSPDGMQARKRIQAIRKMLGD